MSDPNGDGFRKLERSESSDPKGDAGLEEVERALSVLGGRHPGKVRAEREAAEATERRRREREAQAAAQRKRARTRIVVLVIVAALVATAGWQLFRARAAQTAIENELAPIEARYLAMGFVRVAHSTFASQERLELTTTPASCYALVATRHAQMRVERTLGTAGARGDAVLCACGSENLVVTAPSGSAVRALFIPASTFGGVRAMPYHFDDASMPTLIAGGDTCSDEALVAFARDHHDFAQARDNAWLAAHPSLTSAGFATLATAPARLPFVFIDAADTGRCFVASSSDENDSLTLWVPPDQKPIADKKGAIGWCDVKGGAYIVEHAGAKGTLAVVASPSRRIGGMLGLYEQVADAGVSQLNAWERDEDRGALAADALRASVVPDPAVVNNQAIEGAQAEAARVLAFSVGGTGSFVPDVMGAAAFECSPPLSDHTPETVCVQTRGQSWRPPPAEVAGGAAFGPLPFWMSALHDVTDPSRARVELALVGLARRLTARGFEPTIIEGITEKPGSVEILGRGGEDAIVAVGLWPAPPYAHPYSDGPDWTLAQEPRVIPLKGGERLHLAVHSATVALDQRRTVVFRHAAAAK